MGMSVRRDVRVVYGSGLENQCAVKGTVGSNPTLSSIVYIDHDRVNRCNM